LFLVNVRTEITDLMDGGVLYHKYKVGSRKLRRFFGWVVALGDGVIGAVVCEETVRVGE